MIDERMREIYSDLPFCRQGCVCRVKMVAASGRVIAFRCPACKWLTVLTQNRRDEIIRFEFANADTLAHVEEAVRTACFREQMPVPSFEREGSSWD